MKLHEWQAMMKDEKTPSGATLLKKALADVITGKTLPLKWTRESDKDIKVDGGTLQAYSAENSKDDPEGPAMSA